MPARSRLPGRPGTYAYQVSLRSIDWAGGALRVQLRRPRNISALHTPPVLPVKQETSLSWHRADCPASALVELMVALVAGLIVSAAVTRFFISSMKSNGEYVQSTRLTQELRNILDLMSRDVRRAGYRRRRD